MLSKTELEVNLQNSHGQTALHTAARFNIPDAASDLLQRPEVDTNIGSVLGSSPSMVAVKYASKETLQVCNPKHQAISVSVSDQMLNSYVLQILASDARVNLNIVDKQMRKLKDVIGAAILSCGAEVSGDISSILDSVTQQKVARCRVAGTSAAELLDEGYLTMSPPGGVPVPATL